MLSSGLHKESLEAAEKQIALMCELLKGVGVPLTLSMMQVCFLFFAAMPFLHSKHIAPLHIHARCCASQMLHSVQRSNTESTASLSFVFLRRGALQLG